MRIRQASTKTRQPFLQPRPNPDQPSENRLAVVLQTKAFSLNVSVLSTILLLIVLPMGDCSAESKSDLDVAIASHDHALHIGVLVWLPCLPVIRGLEACNYVLSLNARQLS